MFWQAEVLGCEGKVEEAQGVMKLCDQLSEERQQIETVSIVVMAVWSSQVSCLIWQPWYDWSSDVERLLLGRCVC